MSMPMEKDDSDLLYSLLAKEVHSQIKASWQQCNRLHCLLHCFKTEMEYSQTVSDVNITYKRCLLSTLETKIITMIIVTISNI